MIIKRYEIFITGTVQGVGFRPFVYNCACKHGLTGFVLNSTHGVQIEAEGYDSSLQQFISELTSATPPQAQIESRNVEEVPVQHDKTFMIRFSETDSTRSLFSPPDLATCDDCLRELSDGDDRRFLYPFINCTNCGPRFTIIKDLPYDRKNTTMNEFGMCDDCKSEYEDPGNRRFHAQPNACPVCGPSVFIQDKNGVTVKTPDPFKFIADSMKRGHIVAVKGLGGFHLACDATNNMSVRLLRERKNRERKPFAVMFRDLDHTREFCILSEEETSLLTSVAKPIVIVQKKDPDFLADAVAPDYLYYGIILPYTPIHTILFKYVETPLVMTSGNISEDPIVSGNEEALRELSGIADYFLMHNRKISNKCDDSVLRVFRNEKILMRRSRGYVPVPVLLPVSAPKPILACGPHLKNTFCFLLEHRAFISQHIGDLENVTTFNTYEHAISLFKKILDVEPRVIAADLHPEYLATKYALEYGKNTTVMRVQHHHAHIASCMAENNIEGGTRIIGVAFDGTGWGLDASIWGGEFIVADYGDFQRVGNLEPVLMPGGEKAIKEPWRMALAYLYHCYGESLGSIDIPFTSTLPHEKISIICEALQRKTNCIMTTSAGRLFDAVSALVGVQDINHYEGEAPILLEMKGTDYETNEYYPIELEDNKDSFSIQIFPVIDGIIRDIRENAGAQMISAKFHNTIARIIVRGCCRIRAYVQGSQVALSGGVFQNKLLLDTVVPLLEQNGFSVLLHRKLPPNDACISLGQAVVAAARLQQQKKKEK